MTTATKDKPKTDKPKADKAALKAERTKLLEELEFVTSKEGEDHYTAEAQKVFDKMDKFWPNGMKWLEKVKNQVASVGQVISPSGRPRYLWRVFTGQKKVIADAGRRAKNSPVQGTASEIVVISSYLGNEHNLKYSARRKIAKRLKRYAKGFNYARLSRMVHDATYLTSPLPLIIPGMLISSWAATTGVGDYYAKHLHFQMLSYPEIEMEICAREDKSYKWDWTIPELFKIIRLALTDYAELYSLGGKDADGWAKWVAKAMREVFWCFHDKEELEYLWTKYPLLDVPMCKEIMTQIDTELAKLGYK